MNDIEVLEELLQGAKDNNMYIGNKYFYSLENILKERQSDKERIKDLEEINEAHKKENGELREELESVKEIYYTQKEIETDYIPKSLIKEKIEELKEIADEDNLDDFIRIQVLEELLKGE